MPEDFPERADRRAQPPRHHEIMVPLLAWAVVERL
jgi:hypothetical protein